MDNLNKNLTAAGLRNAAFAVVIGFIIKAILDYFYAKNLLLNLSKATVLISNENIIDSISFANQVGRLDLVSLVLALLGIAIGFGAIFGFLYIKESSRVAAKEEVKDWLDTNQGKNEVRKIINDYLDRESEKILPDKNSKKPKNKKGTTEKSYSDANKEDK